MKEALPGSLAIYPRRALAAAMFAALTSLPARAADVLVFAAASTTEAVDAVVAAYPAPPGGRIHASFASSSTLARQIASGAPAHIYLAANEKWMDWLAERDRIVKGTRRDLLRNALVLVAPRDSTATIRIAPGFDLAGALGNRRLALGDPDHVPAGIYAKQALTALGVWQSVAQRTARASDVRGALALVERAETPFGIVYATDAKASDGIRLIDTFPRDGHSPIVYPVALTKGKNTAEARAFLAFLVSGTARNIFGRFGFIVD
ncbi:MAG: molybdate ABC transporter substrate-binding protein [Alphaproteobacteria bacterium]|nr:molybdate ABC transporter substrate-binding protein [Alphaproteobacteria bacterium]